MISENQGRSSADVRGISGQLRVGGTVECQIDFIIGKGETL